MAPGGIELRLKRSQVRGSPELQIGSLRALGEAWMTTFRLRHFSVKSCFFQCFWVLSRLQEVSNFVQGGLRRAEEAQSARTVA